MDSNYEVDSEKGLELEASEDETKIILSTSKSVFNFTKKQKILLVVTFFVCLAIYLYVAVKFLVRVDEEKEARLKESIIEQAEEIEAKYGINIMWAGRCNTQHVSRLIQKPRMTNKEEIKNALDEIEKVLDRYPDVFFDEIKEDNTSNNLNIGYIDVYLCDSIVSSNNIVDAVTGGATNYYYRDDGAYVLLDINIKKDYAHSFSHEIFHIMDSKIGMMSFENAGIQSDLSDSYDFRWIKFNPDGYEYLKYTGNQNKVHVFDVDLPYDIDTEDIDNVYFVNKYAQFSDQEDRAETFTYLIACDDADDLPESYNSPHVKEKAKLLVEMIDDTFDCVDDDAYWARMYREKYGD